MNITSYRSRAVLGISYAILVLLPCVLVALVAHVPRPAIAGTFLTYAFALLPTYYLDQMLLGGIGFHTPAIFALLVLIVAAILWPLPLLSATPAVWHSRRWRGVILGYGAAFIVLVIVAAWQMTHRWGAFFG